jgi:predicted transcriptional regulator/transcriptional regulator with XRE-family HTH domain
MAKRTFLGRTIRRLRDQHGLTQQAMAVGLGISPSYLNLIEHDQRPVTASLILKLAEKFQADLATLSSGGAETEVALREVFADPMLGGDGSIPEAEIAALADQAPNAARAVLALYRAWRVAREDSAGISIGARKFRLPVEEARDFFHDRMNHFPAIETAAEALVAALPNAAPGHMNRALADHLASRHEVAVRLLPAAQMAGALRRYDAMQRTLLLSELLPHESRGFHLACQIGLMQAGAAFDAEVAAAPPSTKEAETLIRVGLLNYFAGSVLMPYLPFRDTAARLRHDIEGLCARFGVSFEQACHRLSTLQRPSARGVPFWLIRIDAAGNVTKRFSAAGFPFGRFGGNCARWVVHQAFATPFMVRTQVASLPDGATFFCFARTLTHAGGPPHLPPVTHAIGLGCDIAHASSIAYADGLDLADERAVVGIGLSCRLCERADCRHRAHPPLAHRLLLDPSIKGEAAYRFAVPGQAAIPRPSR